MEREASFTPTEADYVAANRAWLLSKLSSRKVRWTCIVLAACLLAVTAGGFINGDWAPLAYVGGLSALLAGTHLINWLLVPRSVRRMLDQRSSLLTPNRFAWNAELLEATSDAGLSRVRWDELHRWFEGAPGFVFLLSDRMMLILPARALTEAQSHDLRTTLLAHGRQSANGAAP
jgi:hypothetical protein